MTAFVQTGVHSSDLRQLLQREGFDVKPWRIRYAAMHGHIPTPYTTASKDHAWRLEDVPAIVNYFRNPRRPGRPRKVC